MSRLKSRICVKKMHAMFVLLLLPIMDSDLEAELISFGFRCWGPGGEPISY